MMLTAFILWLPSASAGATIIETCLRVESSAKIKPMELQKLLESEIAQFPSHQIVSQDCQTILFVETFKVSNQQYVTLRMTNEVPVRYTYASPSDLTQKLHKGLRLVLGNDPVYLKENISQYSETQRALHSLKVKGTTMFRLEILESITRTGKGASFGPGLAVGFSKGSNNLYVFSRIHASVALQGKTEAPVWRPVQIGLDGGINYEFNKNKPISGYVGAGLGIGFIRFEGEADERKQTLNQLLVQCFARIGVRMLRLTNFDVDLFVMGYLPFYRTSDVDTTLLSSSGKAYTPHVQMGIGIGF